jgi:4'-phosphopantetheinyl transferase
MNVPSLADDEIHVWSLATLPGPARSIRTFAREALLRLLRDYAGSDTEPVIACDEAGKPHVPALPWLHFNLSHAAHHVLLAFARDQPLGVDLEAEQRRLSPDEIAQRFFAAGEARALRELPEAAKPAAFLRLWTHKEAVLKALGTGLRFGLDRVEFALDDAGCVRALHAIADEGGHVSEWRVRALQPGAGLFAALAWRGAARRVRSFARSP